MFRQTLRPSLTLLPRTSRSTVVTGQLTTYRYLSQEARSTIEKAVRSKPVVLFMKGTPSEPQCGFSRAVVQILDLQGVSLDKMQTYNVLTDPELRSGIKEFSEWPTIPQIYVDGNFVGGCDILINMHQSGELETLLEDNDVIPKIELESGTSNTTEPSASPPSEEAAKTASAAKETKMS